jgi:hypothetical protein
MDSLQNDIFRRQDEYLLLSCLTRGIAHQDNMAMVMMV